jgi:hypothetical protein
LEIDECRQPSVLIKDFSESDADESDRLKHSFSFDVKELLNDFEHNTLSNIILEIGNSSKSPTSPTTPPVTFFYYNAPFSDHDNSTTEVSDLREPSSQIRKPIFLQTDEEFSSVSGISCC